MKKLIKKISTIAMSLAILGTSSALYTNLSNKSENSCFCITAHAECLHHGQRYSVGSWKFTGYILNQYEPTIGYVIGETQRRTVTVKCSKCGKKVYSYTEDRNVYY